jgi:hypothetical protein
LDLQTLVLSKRSEQDGDLILKRIQLACGGITEVWCLKDEPL